MARKKSIRSPRESLDALSEQVFKGIRHKQFISPREQISIEIAKRLRETVAGAVRSQITVAIGKAMDECKRLANDYTYPLKIAQCTEVHINSTGDQITITFNMKDLLGGLATESIYGVPMPIGHVKRI